MSFGIQPVTIGATGDILLHSRVYNKARQKDGTFDFSYMFENVKPLFNKEHVIIVNQESIIAGEDFGLSDFPRFNSPVEIGYTLKDLNVDIVNIANNHTLDHGEIGVIKSIENWEKIGLPYVGAYKSWTDQETLRIIHKNGLKICFLSYTHLDFGEKAPANKKYLLNEFDGPIYRGFRRTAGLRRLITRIKKQNIADVVVVSIHFGDEYHLYPTSQQTEVSRNIADAGADIIIGHHPHVLQPPAFITDSRGRDVFVAYSLGNFLSGQFGIYRQIGAYLTVDIQPPCIKTGFRYKVHNPTMTLTYIDNYNNTDFKINLLKDVVRSQKEIKTSNGIFTAQEVYDEITLRLKRWIPDLKII